MTVTGANGCTDVISVTIGSNSGLTASSSKTNASCKGSCDGTANITATGGTSPYTYNPWQSNNSLCAGTYNITVTDANNCTDTEQIIITEPTVLIAPTTPDNIDCTATVNPSGGTSPYTYQWDSNANFQQTQTATGLVNGTYDVTVTDVNNCTSTGSATITGCTVGIEDITSLNNLNIYPNPSTGEFVIEMKITEPQDFELKLFNVAGQQIYREYFGTVSGSFQKTIDISNFANGIYTVQLISEKGTVNKQITVH